MMNLSGHGRRAAVSLRILKASHAVLSSRLNTGKMEKLHIVILQGFELSGDLDVTHGNIKLH